MYGRECVRVDVLMLLAGARRLQCCSNFVSATVEITKSYLKVLAYEFFSSLIRNLPVFQLWFALDNGFSGQILFDKWCIGIYNVVSLLSLTGELLS